MALIEKNAVDDSLHRLIERRIVKDDIRRLAAQLHRHFFIRPSQRAHDDLADLGGAGEGDLGRQRMPHDRRAGVSKAGDDIDHASRQAGILEDFRELQGRNTGCLGRLDHDAVTHRERRGNFPGQHQQRKIPGNNLTHHPEGSDPAARGHILELVRPTSVIEKMRGGHRDIKITRLFNGFPSVHGFRHRKFARPILEQPGDPKEIFGAFPTRQPAPSLVVSFFCRAISSGHIGGIRVRNLCELLLIRRINGVEILTRRRGYKFTANEKFIARFQLGLSGLGSRIIIPEVAENERRGGRTPKGGRGRFFIKQSWHDF